METFFNKILEVLKNLLGVDALTDAQLSAKLDAMAEGTPLKWRVSVVDFLTLIEIDSSLESRDELATELGIDESLESGSAEKNEAIRSELFDRIAANGGDVPNKFMDA